MQNKNIIEKLRDDNHYYGDFGKQYTGGNTTILLQNEFKTQLWATYRQWQELGFQVQKGQKGERITKMVKIICKKEHKQKLVPRYYTVFNVEQVAKIVIESDLMEAETAQDFTALSLQQLDQMCERAAK